MDISEKMLDHAQRRAERSGSPVILVTIYVRLAHHEEREVAAEFGETWRYIDSNNSDAFAF